jgi:hypothetical protein
MRRDAVKRQVSGMPSYREHIGGCAEGRLKIYPSSCFQARVSLLPLAARRVVKFQRATVLDGFAVQHNRSEGPLAGCIDSRANQD